jgi:hypothetical protein
MQQPNNPIIVARAVELWKRALGKPTFKMFRDGEPGATPIPGMMMEMLAESAGAPTQEQLDKFGEKLTELLTNAQPRGREPHVSMRHVTYLSIDYHPDETLSQAAEFAGISHARFPIKTSMRVAQDYVAFSMGYGADGSNHYPLNNGAWLITDLYGKDVERIIEAVNAGVQLGLMVENSDGTVGQTLPTSMYGATRTGAEIDATFRETEIGDVPPGEHPIAIAIAGWVHTGKTVVSSVIEKALREHGFSNIKINGSEETPEKRAALANREYYPSENDDREAGFYKKQITIYEVTAPRGRRLNNSTQ